MTSTSRQPNPDQTAEPTGSRLNNEAAAEEHTIDAPQGTAALSDNDNAVAAQHIMDTEANETTDSKDDSTILGADGLAGGLSGDGERTNEYDAAVMGLDD
ncbi:hypothetical protein [Spirosoma luteum]|uniref:hypothetical protein n=1 Tax=Spirosoma luteum TaxID=431553 RepID=UPI000366E765|nr:hypothetical protein [Spirosoma luteum]